MTEWSDHVHRYAKKNKIPYREAQKNDDCKEKYKKRKNKTFPLRRKMNGIFPIVTKVSPAPTTTQEPSASRKTRGVLTLFFGTPKPKSNSSVGTRKK